MDLGFAGATAVVVGGGRGMGLATARCLAEDGARVAIIGRSKNLLDRAADELSGCGSPDAFGVVADTTDPARVEAAFAELGERWSGELNVLINTVGPGASGSFEQLTDDQWRAAVDDGVMGMVHGQRRLATQHRIRGTSRLGRVGRRRRFRSVPPHGGHRRALHRNALPANWLAPRSDPA